MKNRKSIAFLDGSVSYSVCGSGPSVILIHGFGEDSRIWNHWSDELSTSYKIITPDIPGSGYSPAVKTPESGLEAYAESIRLIIEAEQSESCIMAGHSMGGYIALSFAEKYGSMLKGLGLIHSTCYADNELRRETRKKSIAFIRKNGCHDFLQTSLPGLFSGPEQYSREINKLLDQASGISAEALIHYQQAMMSRPDRRHVLTNLTIPVFFQLGQMDQAVTFESGLSQCHLPRTSEIKILRNTAHMGMLEEPEKSLAGIRCFLNRIH